MYVQLVELVYLEGGAYRGVDVWTTVVVFSSTGAMLQGCCALGFPVGVVHLPWLAASPVCPVIVRPPSFHPFHPSLSPGAGGGIPHGTGPGRRLRRRYSFGETFASPDGDVMTDDSRQQASISRTVLDRA